MDKVILFLSEKCIVKGNSVVKETRKKPMVIFKCGFHQQRKHKHKQHAPTQWLIAH